MLGPLVADTGWVKEALELISLPALIILNGLFVAAEFALVSVRRTRVEEMVRKGLKQAKTLEAALQHLDRSIAATQLGITLSSIGLGWMGERALARLLTPVFSFLPQSWSLVVTHAAAAGGVAFLLITFLEVVFGELIPKTVVMQAPERTALWLAGPLVMFARLTRPFTLIMSGTANAIVRWLGFEPARGEGTVHSVDELLLLIEDTEEAGLLDPDQADFVENIFRLSNKRVLNCLVPRDKMAVLEVNSPPDKVLEAVRTGAHTRMPVYDGTLDNIVGIVNTKDLFYLFSLQGVVILQDALYPALYLKPEDNMAEALRVFRKSHRPMALVRDGAGKILGLITLEDVLEEIIGDIEDEHDRPTPKLVYRKTRPAPKPGTGNVPPRSVMDAPVAKGGRG